MHILAFEGKPTEFAGGQERSLFDVLQFLSGRGATVSLCYQDEGELLERYAKFARESFRMGSRRIERPLTRFFVDTVRMWTKARSKHWSMLYANQYFDSVMAAALGRLAGIPAVCHLRLACPDYLSRQYRWGLMGCAGLIANSEFTKGSYVSAGIPSDRIAVVHNGVDVERFAPNAGACATATEPGVLRLLYLGRLCPTKGVETLLSAYDRVARFNDRVELRIIGNVRSHLVGSEYLDTLKRLASTYLDRKVFFEPHVADIRSALWSSDLVVVPSIQEEPFGKIVIEAMAAGTPVIASKVGGIPEIMAPRFSDQMVPPGDSEALADAILRFSRWRTTHPFLGEQSRDWIVQHFAARERLAEVFDTLVDIEGRYSQSR